MKGEGKGKQVKKCSGCDAVCGCLFTMNLKHSFYGLSCLNICIVAYGITQSSVFFVVLWSTKLNLQSSGVISDEPVVLPIPVTGTTSDCGFS